MECDIESFNLDDVDVEQLEQRIEMARLPLVEACPCIIVIHCCIINFKGG
jgi:hypothetical protein